MLFRLEFSAPAAEEMQALEKDSARAGIFKTVRKTLGFMESNLKHPSLHTHKFSNLKGPAGEEVFESYAQNNTPGAYRIFWYYGPGRGVLTIAAITPHP